MNKAVRHMGFVSIWLRVVFKIQKCPRAKVHLINSVSDKMVVYLLSLVTAKLFPSMLSIRDLLISW